MNNFYNKHCSLCPRLTDYRNELKKQLPDGWNAPVEGFGDLDGQLLIVGLAPGKMGANRTSRPFTGDDAGNLLYATLLKFALASGEYASHAGDSLKLHNCRITNAVKCVPPQNKPVAEEINRCRPFLIEEIKAMKNLKAILCLGKVSHDSVLKTYDLRQADYPFRHAAIYPPPPPPPPHPPHPPRPPRPATNPILFDSYHCSRYNTNTKRLTQKMFDDVFRSIKKILKT